MDKISSKDAQALLKKAAASIRSLVDENGELRDKLASKERDERIKKIAGEMERKSLNSELTFEEKVATLKSARSLDVAEEAVKLASPQGVGLGRVGELPGAGSSADALTAFILTGEAPE